MDYRTIKSAQTFNTGRSVQIFDPGKIKALIFVNHGYKLPETISAETLEVACHADYPNRIYPIKTIVEFAPNGGDANVQTKGYGGQKLAGYNAYSAAWTLDQSDYVLKSLVVKSKGVKFDVYFVDENNVIYGVNDGTSVLAGIPLSALVASGNDFDTSGEESSTMITTYFKDYEKYLKEADINQLDFEVIDSLNGLVPVELYNMPSQASKYKVIEKYGKLDITSYYGAALAAGASTCFDGSVTAVTYADGLLTITATGTPALKKPSVLQAQGVTGIEQV